LRLVRHKEGKTLLMVPEASLTTDPPPTSPIFFNPAASINRDISVAITSAGGGTSFCDSMAGVGARGVRVANEVERIAHVSMVDFNSDALKAAKRASVLNGVRRKCEFTVSEASSYLFSRFGRDQRFDFVDVDPFGTPVRQIQAALVATSDGGILAVTATDTAVLCGAHQRTCRRRYGSSALNNHFHHETGIRILLGAMVRQGAQIDVGIEPVAAHSTRHYLRVYSRVKPGALSADSSLDKLGYVAWCLQCGDTQTSVSPGTTCGSCGKRLRVAGPLWLGKTVEDSLVGAAKRRATQAGLDAAAQVFESLIGADDFPPWSFSVERICSELKIATVPESEVFANLRLAGHRAIRTPFERLGIKTDAGIKDFVGAVEASARAKRGRSRPGTETFQVHPASSPLFSLQSLTAVVKLRTRAAARSRLDHSHRPEHPAEFVAHLLRPLPFEELAEHASSFLEQRAGKFEHPEGKVCLPRLVELPDARHGRGEVGKYDVDLPSDYLAYPVHYSRVVHVHPDRGHVLLPQTDWICVDPYDSS
jgi:tRNA (guanine26-N2/guanine27-N2)-dimethyltransferase